MKKTNLRAFAAVLRRRFQKTAPPAQNTPANEEFERCALCGALTDIPVSMPIDWREHYEIGFGQLCIKCAKAQYDEDPQTQAHTLSDDSILLAVEQSKHPQDE